MPRFSVIVPAYKVQAYLHDCLRSVLTQEFADLELIAVDDHSPDACGAILDETATKDLRVRAIHLTENVGPGRARNAGLRHATGEYLLFLDGDDTLAPGALRALADRLAETGDPEVLVYGHVREHWAGTLTPHPGTALLAGEPDGPEVFELAERPALLRLPMVPWNKAYRRDFVGRESFAFPPGLYEGTAWTFPVLFTARSMATLDRVCVHHRQRRRGSILDTAGRAHFDVFDQYDRVFAFIDGRPEFARWRSAVFRLMLDQLAAIHAAPGRLPPRIRPEFARRARDHHRHYRARAAGRPATGPRVTAPPTGRAHATGLRALRLRGAGPRAARRGARLRGARPHSTGSRAGELRAAGLRPRIYSLLLRLGACRTWGLLRRAHRCARRAAALTATGCRALRAAVLAAHYRIQRLRHLDERLAVFATDRHRGYAGDPAAIEAAVRKLAPHIRTAWITTPDHAHTLPPGVRRLRPGSMAYWTALARAGFLVNDTGFTDRLRKRPGQIHLQTHRGTPLGHMGLDLKDRPAAARSMDIRRLLAGADRWDVSLSANRHSTLTWERVYPSGFETLEYGRPRNDAFQRATADDVRRIRAGLGIPLGATALLYAPTHRDYQRDFIPRLDPARLARALGPGFVLLARAPSGRPEEAHGLPPDGGHRLPPDGVRRFPLEEPDGPGGDGRIIDVSAHPAVEELCLASDGLITDYSSIMFDYVNLDRPIVIHADDWDAYRATRGVYFDLLATPPGHVSRTEEELIALFTRPADAQSGGEATGPAWCDAHAAELRAAFRERFCPYDDGQAAERVVRRVFLGERGEALPPVVPPAERRPAPAQGGHRPPAAAPARLPLAAP